MGADAFPGCADAARTTKNVFGVMMFDRDALVFICYVDKIEKVPWKLAYLVVSYFRSAAINAKKKWGLFPSRFDMLTAGVIDP